ncbi:MAG: oligosaccharide flippase family protein [Clostridiales bacterium]|nr:oligosaccharide flippase family protein [Clostridiales bacterium]
MRKSKAFLYNALLLVAVSLIMRTVGIYFNVYISNRIGAVAMGVYSLVGGIYGFGITLATSGVNLAVTRLVSEALGREQPGEIRRIMSRCVIYASSFGLLAAVLLLTLSETIAYSWLDDLRTIRPMRLLALALPLISVTSALNGYFTAIRKVYKNAITVFAEQCIRTFFTVLLLNALLPPGIEYSCVALAGGAVLAELSSLVIMSTLFLLDRSRKSKEKPGGGRYVGRILGITLPVAFSSYVRSGLLSVEHALIPSGLKKYGASTETSLAIYGTLSSMVFPVVLFPAVFLTSFSGLLVPELAESRARGDKARIERIVSRIMRLTLLFSIGTGGIMLCYARELGAVLYKNSAYAGSYISLLAPLIPVMYLDSMTDVMLKGLGQQFYSMIVNIADALLSVLLVWLWLPAQGINAYITIIYIAELLNTSLSVGRLLTISRAKPDFVNWIIKPAAAVTGAVSLARLFFRPASLYSKAALAYAIVVTGLLYILLLSGLFALGKDDLINLRRLFGEAKTRRGGP